MTRPKGSKNKMVKEIAKEKVEKEIKALETTDGIKLEVNKDTAMLQPLKSSCKECNHEHKMHYGGVKGHCNTPNCPCLEFK